MNLNFLVQASSLLCNLLINGSFLNGKIVNGIFLEFGRIKEDFCGKKEERRKFIE